MELENMMLIDNLEKVPEYFKSGWRGVMLIRRNKDGEIGNAQRRSVKRISRDAEEWEDTVAYLNSLRNLDEYANHRIYTSVNERDPVKSIHEFKRRQLESDYGNQWELFNFYHDVTNRYFSCLMNPGSRASNFFLIDCDSTEEYEHAELQLRSSGLVVFQYPTKNGMHIITKPFNPNDYGNMTIKKDEMMYIG